MKEDFNKKLMEVLSKENLLEKADELQEKMDKEGISLKQASGITDEIENELYVLGKYYYDQGNYAHARTIFEVINRINPNQYRYVYALASTFHQLKDYLNASLGFYTALTLDPKNPMNPYYLADCFINLQAYKDASHFLDIVVAICKETKKKEYEPLLERCYLIKSSIKGRKDIDQILAEEEKHQVKQKTKKKS